MPVKLYLILSILTGFEVTLPKAGGEQPRLFQESWRATAAPGMEIEDCILEVVMPNPQYPADFQELVRQVRSSNTEANIPLVFTYSYNRSLIVIINDRCNARLEIASQLESYIHRSARLRRYRTEIPTMEETEHILASLEEMFEAN